MGNKLANNGKEQVHFEHGVKERRSQECKLTAYQTMESTAR